MEKKSEIKMEKETSKIGSIMQRSNTVNIFWPEENWWWFSISRIINYSKENIPFVDYTINEFPPKDRCPKNSNIAINGARKKVNIKDKK